MIAPLRRRHRLIVTSLAVLLPLGLVAALRARVPEPSQAQLPAALALPSRPADLPALPAPPVALDGRPLTFFGTGETLWVELAPGDGPARADALLLWSPTEPTGDAPGDDARFLGTLGDGTRSYRLPVTDGTGWIVLYSLARSELLASVALPPGLQP